MKDYDTIKKEMEMKYGNMKTEKILVNKIRCKKCNEIIESKSVHDFKFCSCGAVAVDGGYEYLRRCGDLDGYEELSEVEEINF